MRTRHRATLAASFVVTIAGMPGCDNGPKFAPNPPGTSPPATATPSADTSILDASAPPAVTADAAGNAAPFHRNGPILNPPRPRPMPSGN